MDLYETLGVKKGASKKETKAAFKAKAGVFHPDKKGGSTEKFQAIQKAYEILKDDEKRAHYERTGETGATQKPDFIAELFVALINSGEFDGNIVENMKRQIDLKINELLKMSNKIERKLKKLEKAIGRLSFTGSGENLFEAILISSISDCNSKIVEADTLIGELRNARDEAAGYADIRPEEKETKSHGLDSFFDQIRRTGS